jgi:pseudouridine-5'-phosphate glycosidase/sugar/nucleoside kinase (ribokinase family)
MFRLTVKHQIRLPFGSLEAGLFQCRTDRSRAARSVRRCLSYSAPDGVPPLEIYEPVRQALAENRPVVALESTILSHGIPYPENVRLAEKLATLFREKGVEPATIAVKDGSYHVGLSMEDIQDLAEAKGEGRAVKCSSRELPLFVARNQHNTGKPQWGATTVASTMRIAHMAGISTFVTGGIGGVHRDGQTSMDISADLTELGRTPVIVVSAGIKSILDIHRTLEVLETNAVPVVSYQTDEFPAFFSPHSGVASPARVDDAESVASAFLAARNIGLESGFLVAVPNQDPAAGASVEAAIQKALQETVDQGIAGQAVTPYILMRVAELTSGESLRSNLALVEQNAHVGAEIAIALSKHRQDTSTLFPTSSPSLARPTLQAAMSTARSQVVVMGGIVLDIVAKPDEELIPRTSNPATCRESDGGVGRNIAEVLGRLGAKPLLYSAVGNDSRGLALLGRLETDCGVAMCRDTIKVFDSSTTATYLAVLDGDGDMHVACADMAIHERIPTPPDDVLKASAMLVVDANPPAETLREAVKRARLFGVEVFLEPTSVPRAIQIARDAEVISCLTHTSPNLEELVAMVEGRAWSPDKIALMKTEVGHGTICALATRLMERMDPNEAHIVVTLGEQGALLFSRVADMEPSVQFIPAHTGVAVTNATGAGDSFTGAIVYALVNKNKMAAAVAAGMEAAVASLQCDRTISPKIGTS